MGPKHLMPCRSHLRHTVLVSEGLEMMYTASALTRWAVCCTRAGMSGRAWWAVSITVRFSGAIISTRDMTSGPYVLSTSLAIQMKWVPSLPASWMAEDKTTPMPAPARQATLRV